MQQTLKSPLLWASELNAACDHTSLRPAVVLGASYGGLAILRSVGRRGIPTWVLDSHTWEVGMHSRYAKPVALPDASTEAEAWTDFLLSAGQTLNRRPVIFVAGDPQLEILSANRNELRKYYDFLVPDAVTLDRIADKRSQYQWLQQEGFELPKTLLPASTAEAMDQAAEIGFPCVAKPAFSHRWTSVSPTKLVVVQNTEQVAAAYQAMIEVEAGFVLQEYIEGADDQLHNDLTYLDSQANPLATFTKRKVRQYPEQFGNGSIHVSVDHPHSAQNTQDIFRRLGYVGFGTIEYKLDPRDGVMKLIEINPRLVSGLQLAVHCGCDLPWIAYQDITGIDPSPIPEFRHGVQFLNVGWELQRVWHEPSRSPLKWLGFVATLARSRAFGALSLSDPGPAFSLIRRAF
jgi:predicted ATP-grasp superfamily ATP-dependent carboligase